MKAFVEGIPGGGMPGMPSMPGAPTADMSQMAMPSDAQPSRTGTLFIAGQKGSSKTLLKLRA